MLAERTRVALSLALVVAGTAAVATRSNRHAKHEDTQVAPTPVVGIRIAPATCPPEVRAAMRLGDDVAMICGHGQFPERGTFAIAFYNTTEWWERLAVVADDGHLIVPLTDRPSLPRWNAGDQISFELADLDGDGVDEAVGWYTGSYRRAEIIGVGQGFFSYVDGEREAPDTHRASSCALLGSGTRRDCDDRIIGNFTYSDRDTFVRD